VDQLQQPRGLLRPSYASLLRRMCSNIRQQKVNSKYVLVATRKICKTIPIRGIPLELNQLLSIQLL
jgi:hypothetical protein